MRCCVGNKRIIKIAAIQFGIERSLSDHLGKTKSLIAKAIEEGAEIICLPELFHCKYLCQTENEKRFETAQSIPGDLTELVSGWISKTDVTVIAPIFEKRAPGIYHNSAAILHGSRGLVGNYRKMHIPDDPGYYEKYYFAPGDSRPGFQTWNVGGVKFAVAICWDQWFPEAARLNALAGAEILFYPTAIGWHPQERHARGSTQHEAWELVQRSHAITNGCFVVSVNRIGHEFPDDSVSDGIQFWGQSFVAAPDGRILAKASPDRDEILLVDLDLNDIEQHRIEWPFLRDRRIDAYSGLMERVIESPK